MKNIGDKQKNQPNNRSVLTKSSLLGKPSRDNTNGTLINWVINDMKISAVGATVLLMTFCTTSPVFGDDEGSTVTVVDGFGRNPRVGTISVENGVHFFTPKGRGTRSVEFSQGTGIFIPTDGRIETRIDRSGHTYIRERKAPQVRSSTPRRGRPDGWRNSRSGRTRSGPPSGWRSRRWKGLALVETLNLGHLGSKNTI